MEPITTIFLIKMIEAALGGFLFATVMVIALLCFEQVINWFRSRSHIKASNANNVAFSLQERASDGKYSTVYGIYNTQTDTLHDAETVQSTNVDDNISNLHKKNKLVVYE